MSNRVWTEEEKAEALTKVVKAHLERLPNHPDNVRARLIKKAIANSAIANTTKPTIVARIEELKELNYVD